ncbi:MAG: type II toxin-antitoxin system VapC family toxin [Nitrosospira sp.]|nr:type II toxin-antitoxin system VapC family toxin [Nitrosospira sp.]
MIHLDTSTLVALPEWLRQDNTTVNRIINGEPAAACSIVWYEYSVGPLVDGEAEMARAFLQGGITNVSEKDAELAAKLYNKAGRQRRFKTNVLIAACAMSASAELVTRNLADFEPFVEYGLRLIPAEL